MARLPLLLALLGLQSPALAQEAAPSPDLAYQAGLSEWWSAAGHLYLDESAYRVEEPVRFQDGVCTATMTKGMIVPVWAGEPPISERIVGFVYIGEGELEMDIPLRADRWRTANHLARHELASEETQRAIATGQAPLRVGIERGLVLSADPVVRDLLVGLEPVGGGTMIQLQGQDVDGSDEAFVITDSRGRLRAKAIATNLLPNRRLHLQRVGLDPRVWLRQDRLLIDELGLPGDSLRLLSDWRTDQRYQVAAELGSGIANAEYDRWLTCFRDPMDQEGLGFQSLAFAHGTDPEGRRHFERFSGTLLPPPEERPGAWMEAVSTDLTVATRPRGFGNQRTVDVDGVIELRAVGGELRHVTLDMPVSGSVRGTWRLEELSTLDGRPLARVSLTQDLDGADRFVLSDDATADAEDEGETDGADQVDSTSEAPSAASGGGLNTSGGADTSPTGSADVEAVESLTGGIEEQLGLGGAEETALVRDTPIEHVIQVILPEPVPEGETVKLRLRWSGRWQFANWSTGREVLGTTTGLQLLTPSPVPAPGGNRWDTKIRVGLPAAGVNALAIAVVGDTTREWDEDTWTWIEAEGHGVSNPAVAIGRWLSQLDPPGQGMPGVRVHLFNAYASALPEFPVQARAIIHYFERFLPSFPLGEIEIFQGPSVFAGDVLRGDRPSEGHGLVAMRTVKTRSVLDQSQLDEIDPHMTQSMLARQLAAQHWGQHLAPETSRDAWLADGLAEAFAAFFVRGAFGGDAYVERMANLRRLVEDPVERASNAGRTNRWRRYLSLTGATPASDVPATMRRYYGAYVAADLLRLRLGDQAFFSALDGLAAEHAGKTVSTEDVQAALEAASGEDLDEVFDYWIHGGFVPEVTIEVRREAAADGTTTVHGCIVSDVPWGSFDLPVQVTDEQGKRSVSALVDVDDGRGTFRLDGRSSDVQVQADPLALVLAYARTVVDKEQTTCDRDPRLAAAAAPASSADGEGSEAPPPSEAPAQP